MDNLTHTLIGVVVAEGACRLRGRFPHPLPPAFTPVVMLCSIIANNIPDADLLLSSGPLSYLLNHRGYSHTLLIAPLLAIGVFLLASFYTEWRKLGWSKQDYVVLFLVSVPGGLLHLLLDYSNVYGIHPFWPFDSRWIYGDRIFILEPWLWFCVLPLTFFLSKNYKSLRALIGLLMLIIAGLSIAWRLGAPSISPAEA